MLNESGNIASAPVEGYLYVKERLESIHNNGTRMPLGIDAKHLNCEFVIVIEFFVVAIIPITYSI
jgi:hypothetical protein